MDTIHIVFNAGKNYLQHLCVAMASVLVNTKSPISFNILSADMEEGDLSPLRSLGSNAPFSVNLYRISLKDFKDFGLISRHITIETYFRLMLAEILQPLRKVIYLDSDLIVRADICKLWNENVEGFYAAVVEDILFEKFKITCGTEKYRKFFNGVRCFNAGVILMNLDELRREFDFRKYLELYEEFKDFFLLQDQDVLNCAWSNMSAGNEKGKTKLKFLPLAWNRPGIEITTQETMKLGYSKKEVKDSIFNPFIVHYAGENKPWVAPRGIRSSVYVSEYFSYLAITPFANERKRYFQNSSFPTIVAHYLKRSLVIYKNKCLLEKMCVEARLFIKKLFSRKLQKKSLTTVLPP